MWFKAILRENSLLRSKSIIPNQRRIGLNCKRIYTDVSEPFLPPKIIILNKFDCPKKIPSKIQQDYIGITSAKLCNLQQLK